LVSGSQDKSIKVFDLKTKAEYHHFKDAHDSKNLLELVFIKYE